MNIVASVERGEDTPVTPKARVPNAVAIRGVAPGDAVAREFLRCKLRSKPIFDGYYYLLLGAPLSPNHGHIERFASRPDQGTALMAKLLPAIFFGHRNHPENAQPTATQGAYCKIDIITRWML